MSSFLPGKKDKKRCYILDFGRIPEETKSVHIYMNEDKRLIATGIWTKSCKIDVQGESIQVPEAFFFIGTTGATDGKTYTTFLYPFCKNNAGSWMVFKISENIRPSGWTCLGSSLRRGEILQVLDVFWQAPFTTDDHRKKMSPEVARETIKSLANSANKPSEKQKTQKEIDFLSDIVISESKDQGYIAKTTRVVVTSLSPEKLPNKKLAFAMEIFNGSITQSLVREIDGNNYHTEDGVFLLEAKK